MRSGETFEVGKTAAITTCGNGCGGARGMTTPAECGYLRQATREVVGLLHRACLLGLPHDGAPGRIPG